MSSSPKQIAGEIADHMRKSSLDVMTMRWADFYKFCERGRLKDGFYKSLIEQLKTESILFSRGNSVVVFVKDFDFSPMKI